MTITRDIADCVDWRIPSTTFELIQEAADCYSDNLVLSASNRRDLTFNGLRVLRDEIVAEIRSVGIRRNDRVAIVLPNGPEMAAAFVTVSSAGTCAPLNPGYQQEEFRFYLSDLNARAVIVLDGTDSPVRAVAAELDIPVLELSPR